MATLLDALPAGSYLALSHATADFHSPGAVSRATAVYKNATAPFVPRPFKQVEGFFDGLELVEYETTRQFPVDLSGFGSVFSPLGAAVRVSLFSVTAC